MWALYIEVKLIYILFVYTVKSSDKMNRLKQIVKDTVGRGVIIIYIYWEFVYVWSCAAMNVNKTLTKGSRNVQYQDERYLFKIFCLFSAIFKLVWLLNKYW